MNITLHINGCDHQVDIPPAERLIETLRRLGMKSVKFGCGEGTCGACTVIVDGKARLSCLTLTAQMQGRKITTLEGIGTIDKLHPLQRAFLDEGAVQCGYCTPGMILSSKALLDDNAAPGEDEIRRALDGNRCRCTGYVAIINAVKRAAEQLRNAETRRRRGNQD
ncbi:(2Fe-2S)-binding protein [bacterium]|nr:(2Fe-2S)-binding protein [bacterium]